MRGWLVVEPIDNHPIRDRQVLVLAHDEKEAIMISELDSDKVTHVIKWDGRRKFWSIETDMSMSDYISQRQKNGDLKPHIISDDMFCDINTLLASENKKKKLNKDKEAIEKEFEELMRQLRNEESHKVYHDLREELVCYKPFRRTDGYYSIMDEISGQTLNMVLPNEQLADEVCDQLTEVYFQAYERGVSENR